MEASDRDPLALNQRCIQLNMPTIPRTATWAVMSSRNSPRRIPSATTENEAIGGYQKRLPTNRQNTYPAPDSENDIAYGGLKAYDCRNTGNPLIIPVIPPGTGAPPCVTQGPWRFNGLSRYFPRLRPAKP